MGGRKEVSIISTKKKKKGPDACYLCRLCGYRPGWASRRKDNSKVHFDGNKTKTKNVLFYTLDDQG